MIFIYIAIAYFVVGTLISRNMYAHQLASSNNSNPEIEARMDKLHHASACYQRKSGNYYNVNRPCDCHNSVKWRKLNSQLSTGLSPTNPYLTLTAWPLMGYHHFLTTGTVKSQHKADQERIKELEALCEIEK